VRANFLADRPVRPSVNRVTAKAGEHDGQVGFDGVAVATHSVNQQVMAVTFTTAISGSWSQVHP
jgi:hypothetical protein